MFAGLVFCLLQGKVGLKELPAVGATILVEIKDDALAGACCLVDIFTDIKKGICEPRWEPSQEQVWQNTVYSASSAC
jgi:hypothetical protein